MLDSCGLSREKNFDRPFFDRIIIRTLEATEREHWKRLSQGHFYFGATKILGKLMESVAIVDGEWIACLSWADPALNLSSRDQSIGWSEEPKKVATSLL